MKTTLHYRSLNSQVGWHRQVEKQLRQLHELAPITSADVTLEHRKDAQPAFHVAIRLEVPGPGPHPKATRRTRDLALQVPGPPLLADAIDHTLEAALLKVTHALTKQMSARKLRGLERGRSKLQLSAINGRWTHPHVQAARGA